LLIHDQSWILSVQSYYCINFRYKFSIIFELFFTLLAQFKIALLLSLNKHTLLENNPIYFELFYLTMKRYYLLLSLIEIKNSFPYEYKSCINLAIKLMINVAEIHKELFRPNIEDKMFNLLLQWNWTSKC